MPQEIPVFLFAFANDAQGSLRLGKELNACWNELADLDQTGVIDCQRMGFATLEQIYQEFNRFNDQIYIFHYGGHSDSEVIQLHGTPGSAKNLGIKVGQQENLKLVFLNGCKNYQQVEALLELGIPAVIATTADVEDERAIILAQQFYQALAGGSSIQDAFDSAKAFMFDKHPSLKSTYRNLGFARKEQENKEFSWGLYPANSPSLDWKIPEKKPAIPNILGQVNTYGDRTKVIPNFYTPFPSSVEEIIGREADIQHLRETLLSAEVPVLLNGMGGIGKTRMAIEYANRFKEEYDYIVWIEQLGELVADLTSNLALNQGLSFQPTQDPQADVHSILFQLSRLEGKLLLVIDNADEQIEELTSHLPKPQNAHVLLTSRQDLGGFFSLIELGFLSEDYAKALFYQYYAREKDDEIVTSIVQSIDYHTLTVELFAKTANRRKISLKKLAALFKERGLALGKRADDIRLIRDPKRQLERIFPFLQVVFDTGELEEDEKELLQQFAALPPIFIPLSGLSYLLNIDQDQEETWDTFNDNLTRIQEKGWLIYHKNFTVETATKEEKKDETGQNTSSQEEAYKMHRVIQDVVWEQFKPSFDSVQTIFEQVKNLLSIDQSRDNPIEKFPFVPFAERLLALFPKEDNETIVLLKNALAGVYKEKGRYEEAADLLEKALGSDQANFGEAHPNVATSQSNLALVYQDLGRYEEAARLLEKALGSDQANFGEDHPNVARSQSNLATIYQDLGRYEEAARLLEKALGSYQANFGEDHPNVAISQSNLALVYQNLGRYQEAARLLEKALGSAQANFGEAHPNVATSQSNLALVYKDLGRYEEAAGLLEKALGSAQANFGEDHPNVAISQSNLATVYQNLGRYEEAARLLEKALGSYQANFGEAHPNVARSQSNLALVYQDLGRYEEAAGLLEKALGSDQANFGEDHPNVARSQSNLALVYKDLGRYEEAISYFFSAMQTMAGGLRENHPKVKTIQGNIIFTIQKGAAEGNAYCVELMNKMGLGEE